MPTTAFCRPSSSRHEALGPLCPGGVGPIGTPLEFMNSRNSRRAWSRLSCPSRSRVRSTSDEIENPISPPNTTAYSVVRLCSPTMWLLKHRAVISAVSSTGAALPSPTTVNKFFIGRSLLFSIPLRNGHCRIRYHNPAVVYERQASSTVARPRSKFMNAVGGVGGGGDAHVDRCHTLRRSKFGVRL